MAVALATLLLLLPEIDQARPTPKKPAPPPRLYTTNLTLAEMSNKQAVVNTAAGTFVIDLRPDLAPNHVGYFIKLAREGAYDGTVFHRVIRHRQRGLPRSEVHRLRTRRGRHGSRRGDREDAGQRRGPGQSY